MFICRTHCPACNSSHFKQLWSQPFNSPEVAKFLIRFYEGRLQPELLGDNDFCIAQCTKCGLLFQQSILNDAGMALLYETWISAAKSLQKRQLGKSKLYRKYAAEAELVSRIIKKPPEKIAVIEFGMGWGYWSRMAQAFNYHVRGIELSTTRVDHANTLGVKSVANIHDIKANSIDFIYANQVFEHIPDPLQKLKSLASLLNDNGYLLVRVPNAAGLASRIERDGWAPQYKAIHPLEHINAFTRTNLINMGREAGLKVARAPFRLGNRSVGHLGRSIVREFRDRYIEPHLYFVKADAAITD